MMAMFEVGKSYFTRSICNNDCIISLKVLKRTAHTITCEVKGRGTRMLRIGSELSRFCGCEAVMPYGRYSMAPTIRADKVMAA